MEAFRAAARGFRRAVALPAQAYAEVAAFLADTLDWLNLWDAAAASDDDQALAAESDTNTHHLSPSP